MNVSMFAPNLAHSYSLGILYTRDWFFSCFEKDYFKAWHINGRNIISDYKKFCNIGKVYREKPSVVFTPMIDISYDRELQDLYPGGNKIFIRNYNHRQVFFNDGHSMLSINLREQKMDFTIRTRVESKEQQLNLYNKMMMACRVGFTQKEYKCCDFHIPTSIILNIAEKAGFAVKDGLVVDLVNFLGYLNNHSHLPVMYKYRASTGNNEFFIRISNVYFHLDIPNSLSLDDGEIKGHTMDNYNIEMEVSLKMFVPHFYTFEYEDNLNYAITEDTAPDSCWTIVNPNQLLDRLEDEHGWGTYMKTEYELDTDELEMKQVDINIEPFFKSEQLVALMDNSRKMGISPFSFVNILLVTGAGEVLKYKMNWDTYDITVFKEDKLMSSVINFRIYLDKDYYQTVLRTLQNNKKTSIN